MNDPHKHISGTASRVLPFLGLALGLAAVALAILKLGYVFGLVMAAVPLAFYAILFAIKNPYWSFTGLFVANYFIMAVARRFPDVPSGVILDILLMFTLFTLLIRSCYKHVGWERARNGLTVAALIWLAYCCLELFNPESVSVKAWFSAIRGYAVYFLLIAILTPIIFYRYKDLKRILFIWAALTLLAVFKAWYQRHFGFTEAELHWLFVRGGSSTHIIHSGVRYFSFFSDAANFGSSMGLSMVVFCCSALYYKNFWTKLFFLGVGAAACYGMIISGTRSALAVPFAGFALFILLAKQVKVILTGSILLVGAVLFLNFTTIGQGNALIRRMRSAFNFEDKSFRVRVENQKLMRTYMADRPFGAGLGHGGGKAKEYAPDAYLSQIPTDSWFVMVWVESGVVGLILHVCILLSILGYGCYIVWFKLRDPQLRGLTAALCAGVFGTMVAAYGNEILGQFPNGVILYMSQAFIFLAPRFDLELARRRDPKYLPPHEYAHES